MKSKTKTKLEKTNVLLVRPVTKTPRHKIGKPRGFAAMDPKLVRKIASMGGSAAMSKPGHARKLGRKGGANSHLKTNSKAQAEV